MKQKKKVLFICTANVNRSKTGETIFKKKFETKSAGILQMFTEDQTEISESLLEWADLVVVMEEKHRKFIGDWFPKQYLKKRIINLEIPDIFRYMQPELIVLLKEKMKGI